MTSLESHHLRSLLPGRRARILSLGGERSFRRRLMEFGLLPGTEVRVVHQVDVGGLVVLEVRGCLLSLRQSEAEELAVEPRDP